MLSAPECAGALGRRGCTSAASPDRASAPKRSIWCSRACCRAIRACRRSCILVGASDMLRWLEEGAPPAPSALVLDRRAVPVPSRRPVRLDAAVARDHRERRAGRTGASSGPSASTNARGAGSARRARCGRGRPSHSRDDARPGADARSLRAAFPARDPARAGARGSRRRRAAILVRQGHADAGGVGADVAWRRRPGVARRGHHLLLDRRDRAVDGAAGRPRRRGSPPRSASSRST